MSRLPFEAFLALRYLRPRRTFVSVITVISIIGVLLAVAVLIVVISVMSGFDEEWRSRILGFNAHLRIEATGRSFAGYESILKTVAADPAVKGVAPFIRGFGIAATEPDNGDKRQSTPFILGVDPQAQASVSVLPSSIKEGQFELGRNGVVVGVEYAAQNNLTVGDRITIYSTSTLAKMDRARDDTNEFAVMPAEFVVRGLFDVGYREYNATIVVVSLRNAALLCNVPEGEVEGLQVMLHDPFQAEAVAARLERALGQGFVTSTWQQDNPDIFGALAVEKNMMFYLLFFIMVVAGFGIISCQITFVVQKTREIGILKSLGATQWQVLWVFLSQSVVVGVVGVGSGLGLGLLAVSYRNEFLEFMRRVTQSNLMPASVYQLYQLPASVEAGDVALICGTAFLTCVLAGLFPAWKASRLQPVEALRHE